MSVVVPALDCASDVDGFVTCLRRQTYPAGRFELIVVDNGSRDGTDARLRRIGIRPVICSKRGRSRALNAGLAHASGEIVCTTDMTCRPAADWIAKVVACFDDCKVGCVGGEIHQLAGPGNLAERFQARNNYLSPLPAAQRSTLPFLPFADGANASFRRSVFEQIGLFDEDFFKGADVEICYRLLVCTSYRIVFCREAVVWESPEPNLSALLRQRFRIGMAWNLLRTKYPDLFDRRADDGMVKAAYWRLHSTLRDLQSGLANPRAPWRARVEDVTVRALMMAVQASGRSYGRWHLRRRGIRVRHLDPAVVRQFTSETASLGDRVSVR